MSGALHLLAVKGPGAQTQTHYHTDVVITLKFSKNDVNETFLFYVIKPFNKREGRRGGLQGSVQINREEQSTHAASKKGGGRGRGFAGQQGEGVVEGGAD